MLRILGRWCPNTLVNTGLAVYLQTQQTLGRNYHSYQWRGFEFKYAYCDKQSFIRHWGCIDGGEVGPEGVPLDLLKLPDGVDGIIDIGAHQGLYSVILGVLNKDIPLVSVEPVADNTGWIRKNLELNSIDAEVKEAIVSDKQGEVTFYEDADAHSERHTTTPSQDVDSYQETSVESTTASILADRMGARHPFLKVDAEGEEQVILRELCQSKLDNFRGIVELHVDKLPNGEDGFLTELDEYSVDYEFITESSPDHVVSRPTYYFER